MNPWEKGYKPKPLDPRLYDPEQCLAAEGLLPMDHPAWHEDGEMFPCGWCKAGKPTYERLYRTGYPLEQLIRHLAIEGDASFIFRADARGNTRANYTVIMCEARNEEDAKALWRYREIRVGRPEFRPGSPTANCHASAVRQWQYERDFAEVVEDVPEAIVERLCLVCGKPLDGRPQQKVCRGSRCRKALSRHRNCDNVQVKAGAQSGLSDLEGVPGRSGTSPGKV